MRTQPVTGQSDLFTIRPFFILTSFYLLLLALDLDGRFISIPKLIIHLPLWISTAGALFSQLQSGPLSVHRRKQTFLTLGYLSLFLFSIASYLLLINVLPNVAPLLFLGVSYASFLLASYIEQVRDVSQERRSLFLMLYLSHSLFTGLFLVILGLKHDTIIEWSLPWVFSPYTFIVLMTFSWAVKNTNKQNKDYVDWKVEDFSGASILPAFWLTYYYFYLTRVVNYPNAILTLYVPLALVALYLAFRLIPPLYQ